MQIKKVAIIGRPNVGKSFLFNRLSKTISAITHGDEGVTRDNKYQDVYWNDKKFILIDTGGLFGKADFDREILEKVSSVILEADLILYVVDIKVGILPVEKKIASFLRNKKVILVANKADSQKDESDIYEFLRLGFGSPRALSAKYNRGTRSLLDEVSDLIGIKADKEQEIKTKRQILSIAIIGRPNVGKSSILNRLFNKNLSIVSEISGTTRDSIGSNLIYSGKEIYFVDTAGIRRKNRIKYGVDYFSTHKALDSIIKSDVAILVLDATSDFSDQDQKIASFAQRHYKNLLIVVNKWDLIEKHNKTYDEFRKKVFRFFTFLDDCPILFTSALTNQRVKKIIQKCIDLHDKSSKRVVTSILNEALQSWIDAFPPSHSSGKRVKIFFATQIQVNPPKFVFVCSNFLIITSSYKNYLRNKIKKVFDFKGVTIKLIFKNRGKDEFK